MSLRVLVLTHQAFEVPADGDVPAPEPNAPLRMEYDVVAALRALGHEIRALGGAQELAALRRPLLTWKPHIVFNLLEEFGGEGVFVPYVLGYLRLMGQAFTGCNPAGLLLADDKPLTKKILRYHRIPSPDFHVVPLGRRTRRPKALDFPLIVKSTAEHGSAGIAQASVVTNDEKLAERVDFVHETLGTDAIMEEYVEGRELYVGMLGNQRPKVFPVWEMTFDNLSTQARPIATSRVKWDRAYQLKTGITTGPATALPEGTADRVVRLARRVYRILGLSGYARMDFRLAPDGRVFLLEPNPNPDLSREEDFADAAAAAGIGYEDLIRRILTLGRRATSTR